MVNESLDRVEEILTFWLGKNRGSNQFEARKIWFQKSKETDNQIRDLFEEDVEAAHSGEFQDWEPTPPGRLAIILLIDQFSRNIFRDSPKSFAADKRALELCQKSISDGLDRQLTFIERSFLYMPLMHSEDIAAQEQSLVQFGSLATEFSQKFPSSKNYFAGNLDYAQKHFEIIKKFGRYPHRNKVLGRVSTRQETEFLREPGSSF